MRRAIGVCSLLLALAPAAIAAPGLHRATEARSLYDRALSQMEIGGIDRRRVAIRDLERATLLEPDDSEMQLALGRLYYQAGFFKYARQRFERVLEIAPDDPASRLGLGEVWQHDWLKYLDQRSLGRAIDNFSAAARIRPEESDAWLALVPLLVERQDLRAAAAAARRGLEAAPGRADLLLASAYTEYELGELADAKRDFDAAIPRLDSLARARFEDISPVATERDTATLSRLDPAAQREFIRRFWKDIDPDLTTPENEAQLEYWARVAHAYFLFFDRKRREWDLRGEVYVRYGPPAKMDYNPLGVPLRFRHGAANLTPTGVSFPMNVQVWDYPELGMSVQLQDRFLSEYYLLPVAYDHDPDPAPDPDSLDGHGDRIATALGRGVFPTLPPGVGRVPVTGTIARFEGSDETRVFTQVEAQGGPGDSLWAEWVVLDTSLTEVARGARTLSPSACDPAELRVADFATELEPGTYRVGLTVRDRRNRRGLYRAEAEVGERRPDLGMSDLVITCGVPDAGAMAAAQTVRLDPNPAARVQGDGPLTAYFEIYHLKTDSDGEARFEYIYTVRSTETDDRIWIQRLLAPRKETPTVAVRRRERQTGELRRQFVAVPLHSLPPGKYSLEIEVRDLLSGGSSRRETEFVKVSG